MAAWGGAFRATRAAWKKRKGPMLMPGLLEAQQLAVARQPERVLRNRGLVEIGQVCLPNALQQSIKAIVAEGSYYSQVVTRISRFMTSRSVLSRYSLPRKHPPSRLPFPRRLPQSLQPRPLFSPLPATLPPPPGATSSAHVHRDVRRLMSAYDAFFSGWPQPSAERLADDTREPPLMREMDVGRIPDARMVRLLRGWEKNSWGKAAEEGGEGGTGEGAERGKGGAQEQGERGRRAVEYGETEALAYVAARMPSTYAAVFRALTEVKRRLPSLAPSSLLDFGSGPGTVMCAVSAVLLFCAVPHVLPLTPPSLRACRAASEVWGSTVQRAAAVEPADAMWAMGEHIRAVAAAGPKPPRALPEVLRYTTLQHLSREARGADRVFDVVVAAYAVGEVESVDERRAIVDRLWSHARHVMVLVETGNPRGYDAIVKARAHILHTQRAVSTCTIERPFLSAGAAYERAEQRTSGRSSVRAGGTSRDSYGPSSLSGPNLAFHTQLILLCICVLLLSILLCPLCTLQLCLPLPCLAFMRPAHPMPPRPSHMSQKAARLADRGPSKNAPHPSKPLLPPGAHVLAPCAHDGHCPMYGTTSWCHFSQTLQRSAVQRIAKRAAGQEITGSTEEEKFSYVAFACLASPPISPLPFVESGRVVAPLQQIAQFRLEEKERQAREEAEKDAKRLAKKQAKWGPTVRLIPLDEGSEEAEGDAQQQSGGQSGESATQREEQAKEEGEEEEEEDEDELEEEEYEEEEADVRPKHTPVSSPGEEGRETEGRKGAETDGNVTDSSDDDDDGLDDDSVDPTLATDNPPRGDRFANPSPEWSRVIREPRRRGQHVIVDVCASVDGRGRRGELQRLLFSKAAGRVEYRFARKVRWGDLWPTTGQAQEGKSEGSDTSTKE
ncbi:unnamed protein product [Closterium sp. NIES-54]